MADNENSTSQAMQTMVASANGLAANIGSRREMKRAQQYNLETMERQNQYNVENYKMQRDDAYKREDWLNANSKRIETKALRDAGLNPAWNESSGMASASSVGVGDIGTPSGSGIAPDGSTGKSIEAFMSTMQLQMQQAQIENLRANSAKTMQEARSIENENLGTEESNSVLQLLSLHSVTIGDDGRFYYKGEHDKELHWLEYTPTTKAGYDALQHYREMQSKHAVYQSNEYKAKLEKAVAKLQIEDDTILESLSSMPNELLRELSTKNDATQLETELKASEKYFWKGVESMDNDTLKFLSSMFLTFFNKR